MKNKQMKRMVSILLAAAMLGSVVAGCGKEGQKETETPGTTDVSSQATEEEPKVYVPTEELALTIWNAQGTDFVYQNKIDDNVVANYLYDKTLVTLDNMYGNDGGAWDVKLDRLIAGDNMPHLLYVAGGQGASHASTLREADQIWGISEEMLKEYAPNYYNRVPAEALEAFLHDGLYYGLPFGFIADTETVPTATQEDIDHINTYVESVVSNEYKQLLVRDDALEALYPDAMTWAEIEAAYEGKPMADQLHDIPIFTAEEFVDFMYDIKELDLESLNGKTVYAYGYNGGDNWEAFNFIGGTMMGYAPHYYTGCWNPDTQEIEILLTEDILKEGAKIQNQLIIDQVFDPESLIQTMDMYKEKVLNGQYAVYAQTYGGAVTVINGELEAQDADFRYRPLYVQIPTAEGHTETKSVTLYQEAICLMKTLSEEQVIQILNWVNVQASEEFSEVFWWGTPEDGLYVENADGTRSYKEEALNERFLNNNVSAADDRATHGIGLNGTNGTTIGEFFMGISFGHKTEYMPIVLNRVAQMSLQNAVWTSAPGSADIVTLAGPNDDGWAGIYAEIPEVIAFWAERETWENAFKLALASEDEAQFEERWQEALDVLNGICDVEAMTQKMTEAARASLEK